MMKRMVATAGYFAAGLILLAGCHNNSTMAPPQTSASPAAVKVDMRPTIRIDAGSVTPITDSTGHAWLADTGFEGGDVVDRGADMAITGTSDPDLYRTEHWGMTEFNYPVTNGKYIVKLHFAETSDVINAIGDRIFTVKIGDHEIKDLDVWAKAGAKQKPYIETVPVEVTTGKLTITFTQNVQETEINAIEIIPN